MSTQAYFIKFSRLLSQPDITDNSEIKFFNSHILYCSLVCYSLLLSVTSLLLSAEQCGTVLCTQFFHTGSAIIVMAGVIVGISLKPFYFLFKLWSESAGRY